MKRNTGMRVDHEHDTQPSLKVIYSVQLKQDSKRNEVVRYSTDEDFIIYTLL